MQIGKTLKNAIAIAVMAGYTYLVFGAGFDTGTDFAARQCVTHRDELLGLLSHQKKKEEETEESEEEAE